MNIEFAQYIKPELLILVPVLYVLGMIIKGSNISDCDIPLVLGFVGVVLSAIWVTANTVITGYQEALMCVFTAVVQGVLCAGAAVYTNQLVKQQGEKNG